MKRKLFTTSLMTTLVLSFVLLFSGCSKDNSDLQVQKNQLKSTGWDHGYYWQCYVSSGSGSISFPGAGTYPGNFAASWSNVGDIVAGKGWNPGSSTRTIGYNCGALTGSYNFFGVYGWTTNPLIEYYVCEKGSITYNATYVGSITSNGHSYGLYKHQQVNQPSIIGTATFWQYMSQWGGASTGTSYSITIANHMNAWKSKMGNMGSNNLQVLAVEAYGNKSGYCNATVW
jgi:endo-1,4-beta-xylanase